MLSERKRAILKAIISSYVEHGEPIGSKALCDMLGTTLSSATLRNEMSDLCSLGYLEQPHTSAGRVPTVLGYKLYIDDLMGREALSGDTKLVIDSLLEGLSGDVDEIIRRGGQILSELTGLPVLISTRSDESNSVKRIELVPMGRHSLLAVLITSNGIMRSRMVRSDGALTPALLDSFYKLCTEYIIGKPLYTLGRAYLQQLVASFGDISLLSLVAALFDMIEDAKRSEVSLRGESNLFRFYGQGAQTHRLIELLAQKDLMLSLFDTVEAPVGVLFGNDTDIQELKSATLILAKYSSGDRVIGQIGVLGPTRMSYERVIPSIEYFAKGLSRVISETLTDLED